MNVRAKFGDSRLKSGRIIQLFGQVDPFYALFLQCLIVFCIRLETASDVISGRFVEPTVRDKQAKFRDPRLK